MTASPVFSPIQLGPLTLDNRIVVPAMVTRLSGEDGLVNDAITERYVRFAEGEPGLLVVEAMAVHRSKSGPLLRICDDAFVPGLRGLVDRCHQASKTKVVPQIIHFLKIARSGWRQTVDQLSLEDIADVRRAYADAAKRARECGFDGVELHMAHAYTLSSFLSRLNARKDVYGGSLENRLRFPSEVIESVRHAVGNDFAIGVRFVGEECIKNGYTVVDSSLIAERFSRLGVDYISLSAGGKFEDAIEREGEPLYPYTGYSGDRCMPGKAYAEGANLYLAAAIKKHLVDRGLKTPVATAGKIATHAFAKGVIERGDADLIAMARALLADPDIPKKWRAGRENTVVRCLYGNVCKALDESFRPVVCTLWPKSKPTAPRSDDTVAPTWPNGARLDAEIRQGKVILTWQPASDNEAVYGYEVFRSRLGEPATHLATVRANATRYEDSTVLGSNSYEYSVIPYDLAGNRGLPSETIGVALPMISTQQSRTE